MKKYKDSIEIGQNIVDKTIVKFTKKYVSEVDFVCGVRGSGKSYSSGVIEEEMNEGNWPFIIIDPLGIHRSLRDRYDDVVVIGGEYSDRYNEQRKKLSPLSIVRKCLMNKINCVVDLSLEDTEEQQWFCKEICEMIKKVKPGVLKVIIEECDIFIPQRGGDKDCKEAVKWLVRKERMNGIGMMLICQRFASVDKEVVTQVNNYIIFKTMFNNDITELKKLFGKDIVDYIKQLEQGYCYIDSEYCSGYVKFNERKCVHLGNTPVLGEDDVELADYPLREDIESFLFGSEKKNIIDSIIGDKKGIIDSVMGEKKRIGSIIKEVRNRWG